MDPSTFTGTVLGNTLAAVFAAVVLAAGAWLAGPLRWLVQNRKVKILVRGGRRFRFFYDPVAKASKVITFQPGGTIGDGNQNEHSWRVRRGKLEILGADGKLYSRFQYDQQSGHLRHTNDTDCRSNQGQYIQPLLVKVA